MRENLIFDQPAPSIGRLTLSQPQRRNALNASMWAALPAAIDAAIATGIKCLIVRGDGDHFAAGADISEFGTLYATQESTAKISADIKAAMNALAACPVPTLALIRGACVGGGCGLALCCDIRFADNTAKFAITPAKLGLVYPYDDVQRLIETVGMSHAKDILLSARLIKAKQARKMGLINHLCKVDNLEANVMDYAESLTALSAQSLKITKQMFAAYSAGQRGDNDKCAADFLAGFSSDDFKEGYSAFMEKRRPEF